MSLETFVLFLSTLLQNLEPAYNVATECFFSLTEDIHCLRFL